MHEKHSKSIGNYSENDRTRAQHPKTMSATANNRENRQGPPPLAMLFFCLRILISTKKAAQIRSADHVSRLSKAETFYLCFATQLKFCRGYPWPQKSAQSAKFQEKITGC